MNRWHKGFEISCRFKKDLMVVEINREMMLAHQSNMKDQSACKNRINNEQQHTTQMDPSLRISCGKPQTYFHR